MISITLGQTFEISGTIKDESGKKISNARLTLYSSKYQLVKTERTKGNGKFKFKKITPDKYTLNIYGAGGNSATKEIDLRSKSVTKLEVTAGQDDKQPQLTVESEVGNVILKWEPINNTGEYIIFRDNTELTKTSKPSYKDKVIGGKSYAYNITAVDNNGEKGTRSLTEHGKALLKSPANIKAFAKKNTISLSWDVVQNANSYNIYRDDDLINTTTELEYSDYKLKYDEDYAYTIVSVDHHKEEGPKSSSKSISTHKEVKKIKKIKAEAGESIVELEWTKHDLAVKYKIYQNGTLIDSVKIIKYTAKTDPGTENCFTVSAVDKHGTEGPQSVPACDKAQFPPPEKVSLILGEKYSDEMNSLKIKWDPVDGPASYNIYRDGKSLTNSKNTNYHDKDLDFGKEYTYEISSLSDDGLEGPLSEPIKKKTPKIFKINGQLINEKGQPKIEEAKVFLYNNNNVLWEEYTAGSNGKFTLENRIISGNYRIKVFGNGHGNNGEYAGNG
ncbi:hypothetical protein HN537_08780, partial [bacterium]|nr:hypothetical protein [bacterium]